MFVCHFFDGGVAIDFVISETRRRAMACVAAMKIFGNIFVFFCLFFLRTIAAGEWPLELWRPSIAAADDAPKTRYETR